MTTDRVSSCFDCCVAVISTGFDTILDVSSLPAKFLIPNDATDRVLCGHRAHVVAKFEFQPTCEC